MKENGDAQHMLTLQQTARWLPADMDTPISLFMGMVGAGNGILLESAEVDGRWGRYSILACDAALFISWPRWQACAGHPQRHLNAPGAL